MAQVWAAYTHTVHYLVDTEDEYIEVIELPGWMNTFQDPDTMWFYDGTKVSEHSDLGQQVIKILENEPLPNEVQS
jgi:hypothetical protein